MKIAFLDFWYDFQPENNFFIHILRLIKQDVRVVSPEHADVIIYSCFGNQHLNYHCKKIFYTGENLKPNYNECNYSLSFEFTDNENKNIRLPLWYLYIDWFGVKSYGNPNWLIPLDYLCGKNEFTDKVKDKFCCSVFSARYDLRFDVINKIGEYKSVDCYGKLPNFTSLGEGERVKMDVISDYKFNVCFENTNSPGYFTEKLLHSKVSGAIPIYYSNITFYRDFNPKCCIHLEHFPSIDRMVDYIHQVDCDDNLYNDILNEPLFTETPTLDKILKALEMIL